MKKNPENRKEQDQALADLISMEYYQRWMQDLQKEEEAAELKRTLELYAENYGASPKSPASLQFAGFVAGMSAGLDLAQRMDGFAQQKKGEKHGTDESATL